MSHLDEELSRLRGRYDAQPSSRAFAPLADCYRKMGRLDEALELCLDGLRQHPRYATAHVILGKVYRDRKEPEDALRVFETVVELDEMNLIARRECASLAEELGDLRRAYEHWNRLLAADPEGEEAELAIERLAESPQLGAPVEAVQVPGPPPVDAPAEDAPQTLEAALDDAELTDGPPDEAPPAEEPEEPETEPSSLEMDERGIATITLARIYYEQGFKAKALDVYERVLEENPGNEALARRVETIRAELHQLESRAEEVPEILEDAFTPPGPKPGASGREDEADLSREVDALAASIEAADAQSRDYSQFRSWLSRVKDEDEE